RDWNKTFPAIQGSAQTWISELAKQADSRSSFNELLDTPIDFSNFIMNQLCVDTLTPELLAGPTYELMRGSCTSLTELEYHLEDVYKAKTDQLDWVNPEGASSQKYTTSVTKAKAADYGHIKWIEDLVPRTMCIQEPLNYDKHALWGVSHWERKPQQFYGFAVNRESALNVYSKRRIIVITDLKIVEWHNYKHLDWILVRRDDDKIYKFIEGNFKRLRLQDIEDMLLLLVQGKLSNLTVEERFAFNKRLNLTKPDTYRSDLMRRKAYIAYSNPRGFIYQNKDKKNRLMRIGELHKFSDGTLNDVRNALDDRLKGIRMKYLPQTIWRKGDKDRAAAMIQSIDKMLKTRRIMRSLERFVGGRLNKTAHTSHSDPHGIIYVDQSKRNRLMRTDELYKFSDGTLNDVRTALHDIATRLRMDYLPMRRWSNLDKKRARVMLQDIDKQLNMEKFADGRPYGDDLRLLERII
nr:hypothetical protein [Tanacetum cinerariifolium]